MGWFQTRQEPIESDSPEQRLLLRLREEGIEVREHALKSRELAVKQQADEVEQQSKLLLERSELMANPQNIEAAVSARLQKLERDEKRLREAQHRLTLWEETLETRLSEILNHEQSALRGTTTLPMQRAIVGGVDSAQPAVRLANRPLPVVSDAAKVTKPEAIEMSLDPPVNGAYLEFQEASPRTPLSDAHGAQPRRRAKTTYAANSDPELEETGERIHHLDSDPIHLKLAREVAALRKGIVAMQQGNHGGSTRMIPMSLPAEDADDAERIPRVQFHDRSPDSVVLW